MKSYIDLHLHTCFSDGEDTPKQLLNNIIKNNVKFFSITDHDTIKGNIDFNTFENKELLTKNNITYVTGIEISSTCIGTDIHILGLNYDINSPSMIALADKSEKMRKHKALIRIDYIKNVMKINLSQKSIDYLKNLTICAKPHFAKCFVDDGFADNIIDALSTMTKDFPDVPCTLNADYSISTILASKGIPVWAHPLGGINEPRLSKETFINVLEKLIEYGLKGLECYYSLYSKDEIDFLTSIAKKYGLFISAGSDYHGKNVKKVSIGEVSAEDIDIKFDDINIIKNFK